MLAFLKERILLFILVIASDWVSLARFLKADEIRQDAITIAIAVSLIPSLVISVLAEYYFQQKVSRKNFVVATAIISTALWIAFIFAYLSFNSVNNEYGKFPFPKNLSAETAQDSVIVGGCNYTIEAQAEVDFYARQKRTLTPLQLFQDFNFDLAQVWPVKERDCARGKILNSFAIMLAFLIAGITLTCEMLISNKKQPGKKPSAR